MINKRIVYEDNNGVKVVSPSPQFLEKVSAKFIAEDINPDKSMIMALEECAKRSVPLGVDYEIVDVLSIPSDRTFRNAWVKGIGKVEVDMPKAQDIHMDRIREVRNKKLDESDKEVTRALEDGPVTKALKDKRQALLDIPQTFDLSVAKTPEELKVLWPSDLPRE